MARAARDLDASVQRLWAAREIKPHLSQSSSMIALNFLGRNPLHARRR
jgi:hypothetical protein